jgi:hypothetical protein
LFGDGVERMIVRDEIGSRVERVLSHFKNNILMICWERLKKINRVSPYVRPSSQDPDLSDLLKIYSTGTTTIRNILKYDIMFMYSGNFQTWKRQLCNPLPFEAGVLVILAPSSMSRFIGCLIRVLPVLFVMFK